MWDSGPPLTEIPNHLISFGTFFPLATTTPGPPHPTVFALSTSSLGDNVLSTVREDSSQIEDLTRCLMYGVPPSFAS